MWKEPTTKERHDRMESTEIKELRTAFEKGVELGYWKSVRTCAEAIRLTSQNVLYKRLLGYREPATCVSTTKKILQYIDEQTGPSIHIHEPFSKMNYGQLVEMGKKLKLWESFSGASAIVKCHRDTLTKYKDNAPATYPGQRCTKLLRRIHSRLRRSIESNIAQRSDVHLVQEEANTQQKELHTTPENNPPPISSCSSDMPTDSGWYNRLIAGVSEFTDQVLGGIRFVLTKRNFRKLKGIITKEEVTDTRLLIEELRRRCNLIAQIEDPEIRELANMELAAEFDELFNAFGIMRHVVPTKALERMDRDRTVLAQL